ncbi:aspartate aminotransferase family protein [Clostridium sp. SHJSY1]|uniref:aspartate aminotransferase family protein n=1 Tax=Clostridium sp. SHJSY1 TaxID=2942483 RepID=UPI002874FC8D|nr:aspartate aminotransferase family protein [Clostridium sp. SHJSY1]MDS0528225.1 aspartate aminotransferase family protein [Clostridium sp. SHJSY1]
MKNSLMSTYAPLSPVLAKGDGVYLYDTDGNKYLDFTSGIGVNSLGYSNAKWTKAVNDQVNTLQHCSNIFLNPVTVELSNKLTSLAKMDKVFFANSGAEANEGALKLARKYSFDKYGGNRNKILSLKQSFHGRTLATLTANGQEKFHNYFFPFPKGFDYVEANNIDDFKSKLTDDVCAIIMEAVQGEGGIHPLQKNFVTEVVSICNSKDVVVIFDEVQSGIARTGNLFGFNHFDVEADIVTVAKGLGAGLPIGAVLCNKKLSHVFNPGDHGTTFGGNPTACAGALVVLDEICNDKTYNAVTKNSKLLKDKLIAANLDKIVEIRGIGLMIGIEIKGNASQIQQKAIEKGLFVLTAGTNVIRLLPPIIISEEEILKGTNILVELLK